MKMKSYVELDLLSRAHEFARPKPYNHPDLLDVTYDKHQLVRIEELNIERGGTIRSKDHVFQILPSLPQKNSMYWVLPFLFKLGSRAEVKIRLDPFMIHPAVSYTEVAYKMRVYGTPLDWNDISNLKEVRHARWMPDSLGVEGNQFTDVAWDPRSDGIHFVCEEVPTVVDSKFRGSRYLHGIYNPMTSRFAHVDGAIRLYTEDEISNRHLVHVRNSGKSGIRIKIFQADGEIDREMWCNLAASFFVWNKDVQEYFTSGGF
ncbi:hypothetical protein [Cohnella kolymensis]|nr:hypothetical protein [Cohnella kolymensis]